MYIFVNIVPFSTLTIFTQTPYCIAMHPLRSFSRPRRVSLFQTNGFCWGRLSPRSLNCIGLSTEAGKEETLLNGSTNGTSTQNATRVPKGPEECISKSEAAELALVTILQTMNGAFREGVSISTSQDKVSEIRATHTDNFQRKCGIEARAFG